MDWLEKSDSTVAELSKFSDEMVYLGPSIKDNRLEEFEKKIGFLLPVDFKYIFMLHNGFSLNGTEVYGMDIALRGSSVDEVYNSEHFKADKPMPLKFMPFSPDGYGNHYCFDLSAIDGGICPVIFWQHDVDYKSVDDVEICNQDFTDWINEVMIEWTLDDYDYNGNEKSKDL